MTTQSTQDELLEEVRGLREEITTHNQTVRVIVWIFAFLTIVVGGWIALEHNENQQEERVERELDCMLYGMCD